MFYGNSSVTTDQSRHRTGVWDSNYVGASGICQNGSTLTANDSTTNANNATVHGSASRLRRAGVDGAATFGASTANYLQAGDASSLRIASAITLSAWVYNTANNSNGGLIVEKRDATSPGSNYNYGMWLDSGGKLVFEFNDGSYRDSTTTTGAVPQNAWTYIIQRERRLPSFCRL